jgi:hypothetical protein
MAEPDWIGQLDARDLVVFVHVPKAGGTSFNAILWQVYGRHFVNYNKRMSKWSPARINRRRANDLRAIAGHFPFGFHATYGREYHRWLYGPDSVFSGRRIRYVAIVRDPVERAKSYYRFVTSFPAHHLYRHTRGMSPPVFFDYLQRAGIMECENQQCHLIGGATERRFAVARERIINDYLAVAALEDFNSLVEHLSRVLHWPNVFELKVRNQSPRSVGTDEFDAHMLERIREMNAEDLQLHHFARQEASQYWRT